MDFGIAIPTSGSWADPVLIRDAVQVTEELGFSTAWFSDHVVIPDYATELMSRDWYDPLSCMLVAAGATHRVRLGSDVLVAPYRNPVLLSQILASADQLSGGRMTLGIGVGYVSGEFAALGAPYADRGAMTDEYLQVLRVLWESDGAVSFDGRWVEFERVHARPRPWQRPLPIWVGGNGVAGRRRAALLGDGWHPLFPTPERYATNRAAIVRIRAEAGLDAPFAWSLSTARVQVLASAADAPAFAGYAGRTEIPKEFRYAPAPPADADGRPRFVGTAAQVREDVRAYEAVGVEHIVLRFWVGEEGFGFGQFAEQLELFASEVRETSG
jgi:probable F420-dependent oxidoreductase